MQLDRLSWRERISRRFQTKFTLSFRASRLIETACETREEAVAWLVKPSTQNIKGLGAKTYNELLAAFDMAVPTKGPRTLEVKLRAAESRIAELEAQLREVTK
jgi:hypothetical protein